MDMKHSWALKKKRELLGTTSKRKMSLRNNIDSQKQNECRLDITQITKCVFLGSLCLKPAPQLFDSPLLLEELDMKVGNVKDNSPVNNENINGLTNNLNNLKQKNSKKTSKQKVSAPTKPKKKSLREKNEIKLESNGITKTVSSVSLILDSKDCVKINGAKSVVPTEKHREICEETTETLLYKNNKNGLCKTQEISPDATITALNLQIESVELLAKDEVINSIPREVVIKENLSDLKFLSQDISNEPEIYDDICENIETKTMHTLDIDEEDLERLKREPTPEIILSDSDEDAIDQLMYNIMDIKVGSTDFGKDLFNLPQPDTEQYTTEYSSESTEKDTLSKDEEKITSTKIKKYIKRNPQCKICSKVFNSYSQLKKHKASHDGEKPYVCLKCNENQPTLDHLLAHLRTHQGKRPYVCKKCNEGFKSLKALENHQPVHVLKKTVPEKKQYQCEVCSKEFRKLCDLERHTRVHTGEKPSVCNICNKRFQQAHNLNKHLLIHTKLKSFECDICHKKFGRNDVLNRHLLTHSVKKPHQCEICFKSFIRISQLMAHKAKSHSEK